MKKYRFKGIIASLFSIILFAFTSTASGADVKPEKMFIGQSIEDVYTYVAPANSPSTEGISSMSFNLLSPLAFVTGAAVGIYLIADPDAMGAVASLLHSHGDLILGGSGVATFSVDPTKRLLLKANLEKAQAANAANVISYLPSAPTITNFGIQITNANATDDKYAILWNVNSLLVDASGTALTSEVGITIRTSQGTAYTNFIKQYVGGEFVVAEFTYEVEDRSQFRKKFVMWEGNGAGKQTSTDKAPDIAIYTGPQTVANQLCYTIPLPMKMTQYVAVQTTINNDSTVYHTYKIVPASQVSF